MVEKPFYVPSGSDCYVPSSESDCYIPSSGSDSAWLMSKRSNHVHVDNEEEKLTEDYDYDFNNNYDLDIEEDIVIDKPATDLDDDTEKFVEQEITKDLFIDGYLLNIACDLNTPYTCDDKLYDGCDYSLKEFVATYYV